MGSRHTVDRAAIRPLPPEPIPIWFGGSADRALRRAAEIGDGFVFGDPEGHNRVGLLRRMLERANREDASFGIEGRIAYGRGVPEDWQREIERWYAVGATHVALNTLRAGLASADDYLRAIERFAAVTFAD